MSGGFSYFDDVQRLNPSVGFADSSPRRGAPYVSPMRGGDPRRRAEGFCKETGLQSISLKRTDKGILSGRLFCLVRNNVRKDGDHKKRIIPDFLGAETFGGMWEYEGVKLRKPKKHCTYLEIMV